MRIKAGNDKRGENNHCYDDINIDNVNDRPLDTAWYFSHKENQRYYVLIIQKDLFETIVVTKVWGSKKRQGNRMVHTPFNTKSEALAYVDKIIRIRERRGYELGDDDK